MSESIGPALPVSSANKNKSKIIGPTLPPHLLNKDVISSDEEKSDLPDEKITVIGPSLPPQLLNKSDLPNESSSSDEECPILDTENKDLIPDCSSYGPALPPHLQKATTQEKSDDDDDEDNIYGPLPLGAATSSQAYQALEERALQIKLGQLDSNEDKPTVREEWMMELPDVQAKNLGLGPRQFRKNARPDFSDRSSWTDTPQAKVKKLQGKTETKIDLKKEAELLEIQKRDDEQRQMAEKHNKKKKRDKSLLEIHQDKQKKKKKDDDEGPTRRPFSREIDLQVNRLDEAQKKSIMKKAMLLDDRFSTGQSKFL